MESVPGAMATAKPDVFRPEPPKPPDTIGDKKVTEDKPNVKILMVGQGLETHLEAEGHDIHGAECQENPPLEPAGFRCHAPCR